MRRATFILACLMLCLGLQAQEKTIILHGNGSVLYETTVSSIGGIGFLANPASLVFNNTAGGTMNTIPISSIDSVTFGEYEIPSGEMVMITFNGNDATIVNPFANDGVSVEKNQGNVIVYSTKYGVPYYVTGSSTNGSLTVNSNSTLSMTLHNLTLSSGSTAAINFATACEVNLVINGTNTLTDNANSSVNGALHAAGNLNIDGTGLLRITGNAKHGILADGILTVNSGEVDILETDSDGIHGNSALNWNGGTLNILSAGSDGLDFSGNIAILDGDLTINNSTESSRGIKVSGIFNMSGGNLTVNTTGNDGKGIKCDSTLILGGGVVEVNVSGEGSNGISSDRHISVEGADVTVVSSSYDGKCFKSDGTFSLSSGSINLNHSGNISKGIKAVGDITVSGGTIDIHSSGSTVITDNDPAYCTAIKGDANVIISGGDITINLPNTNQGGKGISCAGNMTISGNNTINIETHGDGATYPATSPTDTYSSSCLRAEGNMQILSGDITLSSTGKAGKGIKVGKKNGNTYTGTYTQGSSDGTGPSLTISTTGAQVGSGGGGWPPGPGGGSSVRSSAKAIKVGGAATIYGGTTTVTTTKSGAEGLESKTQINIEGGQHYFKCYDDCIGSSGKIFFNGGVTVCFSNGNDAIDSNAGTAGAITIGNGVVFAYTTKGSPEEGFDCDNNSNIRITGTGIGISAGGSQGGGWPGPGGGGGNTISGAVQGYYFHTNSINFQAGKYYTLSNTNGAGGSNMVTFSFETNCNSNLALITATGMVSGTTYYVKYGDQAPTNPTTAFHGLYLGGASSSSIQAFSFTAQ
jgi:hypothetical protein